MSHFVYIAGKNQNNLSDTPSNQLDQPQPEITVISPSPFSPRVLTPSGFVVLCRCSLWQPIDEAID